jgi:hypothetical protein
MAVVEPPRAVKPERLTIVIEPTDEGWYAVHIEEIPEAISQGRTPEEARRNVLSALRDLLYEPTFAERVLYRMRARRADMRDRALDLRARLLAR